MRVKKAAQKGVLASIRDRLFPSREAKKREELLEKVSRLSKTPFKQLNPVPEEMMHRIGRVLECRSHSQLLRLKENLEMDEADQTKRRFPLNAHEKPVGWTMNKSKDVKGLAFGPQETLNYMAFNVDSVYSTNYRVLKELQSVDPNFEPKSMLDFGSGPGTSSWAAKELFKDSIQEYRIVEPSQSMLDASMIMLEGFNGLAVRRSLAEMRKELESGTTFDLIVASYVLTELPSSLERVVATSALWQLLSPNGKLVIVDRGSSWGSFNVRSARQLILDSVENSDDGEEAEILAPCSHKKECPMSEGQWCHFVQRTPRVEVPKTMEASRVKGFKTAKFSYLVMEKKRKEKKSTNQSEQEEKEKEETVSSPSRETHGTSDYGRLVRGPLVASGHVLLDMCHPEGELKRIAITKRKVNPKYRAVYRSARKSHWGGKWPVNIQDQD